MFKVKPWPYASNPLAYTVELAIRNPGQPFLLVISPRHQIHVIAEDTWNYENTKNTESNF